MRIPPAIIDTNVVVSGLLTADSLAPTARIVDAMLAGRFTFLLSVELLAEHREVLLRPAIRSRHELSAEEVDAILIVLAANAAVREPVTPPSPPPDPGDNHLWSLLACHPGAVLVTGGRALLTAPPLWASVESPAQFAELLPAG